jgi:hypothetical protein
LTPWAAFGRQEIESNRAGGARVRYQEETMEQQARQAVGAWHAGVPWPAPLLPPQLVDRPHRSPEQRLMAAVLEDAIRELERPSEIWIGPAGRRRAEVQAWVESDDVAWPFSFLNVCDALDLNPAGVRRRIARLDPGRGSAGVRR